MPAPNRHRLFGLFATASLLALATFPLPAHQVDPTGAASPALATSAVMATGTVAEMIVNNQASGVTLRYLALRSDEGQTVALTGAGLDLLSRGTRVTATGSLTGNVMTVTSVSILPAARVAGNAGAPAQSDKVVQGTLVVFHKDYFAQDRGEYGLGVHDGATQMTPLKMAVIPDALRPGMTVRVSGTTAADGVSLDVSQITILGLPPVQATGPAAAPATNNVLVMPIKFADSPASDPFTPSQVDQVMRTNAGSVAAYYNEVSYGQQQLNITVACATAPLPTGCATHTSAGGWLLSSSAAPANCDFTAIGNLADQAATAAGYNIANYINRFYVLPGLSCGWAGLAYVGYPYQAWSNAFNVLWVYGHELGHNFTLWHAGSLNCNPQVIGGGCSVSEYGDRFDIMGNNSNTNEQMHFNAMQKAALSWIPASSVMTHTSGTATYTLSPLESGGQATYAVKIPVALDTNRTYWIEYRQPIGFDSGIAAYPNNGAQIRVARPFDYPCSGCGGDDTELLDMTPGSGGGPYDAALVVGQSFTDSTYGIHVTVNSATSSALSVTVSIGGPTVSSTGLASSGSPSLVGANVTFTATVTGSAPTGAVAFTADSTTLSGCGAVTLPAGSSNSKIVTCSTSSLSVGTHSIMATYAGDAANSGSTSATLSQVVSTTTDVVWVDDVVPAGAISAGDGGDGWNWVSSNPTPYSGTRAHQSALAAGEHQHYFFYATNTLTVGVGDSLFAYVYLDPANPPSEVMLQWWDGSSDDWHRAYWGANLLGWGTDGTVYRHSMGALPATGQWVRLSVPAAQLGLEGKTLSGMAYSLYGGRATWDYAGRSSGAVTTTMLASSGSPSLAGANVTFTATVTGSAPTGAVAFTADSMTLSGCGAVTLPAGSSNSKIVTCSTSSLSVGTHSIVASYAGDAVNNGSVSATLSQVVNTATDVVWVDDVVPAGAISAGDGGDGWNWVSSNPTPYSGTRAHQSALAAGEHQHYFFYATNTLTVGVGDSLFAYVYLDPANPPSEVMLQWWDGSSDDWHRAYWGANLLGWGTDGTVYRHSMGALPATGQWVRLSVPAAQLGLEGKTLSGMAYSLYGGRATWDYAGRSSGAVTTTMLASSGSPSLAGANVTFTATVTGSAPTGAVAFTADSMTLSGCGAVTLPAGSSNSKIVTCSTSSLSVGTHSIVASYAGDAVNNGSVSATLSQVVNTATDVVWVDDVVPAGAISAGDGGDGWNWVSSNPTPYSGTRAHQSALAAGEHQHYFFYATNTLTVGVGDSLFAYVYLDPANPPSEVMLQWWDGSSDDWHRAYWGANLLGWGTDGTVYRHSMGALPATGQWVRLSVPAAQLGLEGKTLSGMAYSLYGGRATWDYAGKSSPGP